MGRFADVPDLFFPPPLPAPPLRLGNLRPAFGCLRAGAHSPVKAAAPLAGLGANLASATSAGLSAAQRALASRQGVTVIGEPQYLHTGARAAIEAFGLLASLGMDAPVRRRRADAPRTIHALAHGQIFGMTAR